MRLAGIDSKIMSQVNELCASSVELAREKQGVVRDKGIAGKICRHPSNDREVETMTVVCDEHVVSAEFTERRPDLLEVRFVGDFLRRNSVSVERAGGDQNARLHESLIFGDNRAAAHFYRCDLDYLGLRCVVVGRLEIDGCEVAEVVREGGASNQLSRLEQAQPDAEV